MHDDNDGVPLPNQVYLAASVTDGQSFGAPVRISDGPHSASSPKVGAARERVAVAWDSSNRWLPRAQRRRGRTLRVSRHAHAWAPRRLQWR